MSACWLGAGLASYGERKSSDSLASLHFLECLNEEARSCEEYEKRREDLSAIATERL